MVQVMPKSTKVKNARGLMNKPIGSKNSLNAAASSGNPSSKSGPDGSIPAMAFTMSSQGLPGALR